MTIEFQCDGCQKMLRTADDKAGQTARCPHCGMELTVPEAASSDFEEVAPPPVRESHLSDFEELTKAPPRRRPAEPVAITCPMCGEVNESTTERCLACGEPLEHFPAEARRGLSTRFGDIWNRAWEIFSANLGINIAAAAICGAILTALSFAIAAIVGLTGFALQPGFAFQPGIAPPPAGGPDILALSAVQLLQNLVTNSISALLMFSLCRFALENVRRENPTLGEMVLPGSRTGAILFGAVCYGLVFLLLMMPGFVLSMVGLQAMDQPEDLWDGMAMIFGGAGLNYLTYAIAVVFFWPAPFLFIDRSLGAAGSLIEGPRMALRFFGLSMLLGVTHVGLIMAGWAACCVGLLFSLPLSFMLFAVAYERCQLSMRDTVADSSNPQPPPA